MDTTYKTHNDMSTARVYEEETEDNASEQEEVKLIQAKNNLEQIIIYEYRDVFSESLKPRHQLLGNPTMITACEVRDQLAGNLYSYRPRLAPINIINYANKLLENLVRQGIIREVYCN